MSCPIDKNNPYKKIIEQEEANHQELDWTKVQYYIDPKLINLIGFENTMWSYAWRKIVKPNISCYDITAKHHPHENKFSYIISFLDKQIYNKLGYYDAPLFEGHIKDFKGLVERLEMLRIPLDEAQKVTALRLFLKKDKLSLN